MSLTMMPLRGHWDHLRHFEIDSSPWWDEDEPLNDLIAFLAYHSRLETVLLAPRSSQPPVMPRRDFELELPEGFLPHLQNIAAHDVLLSPMMANECSPARPFKKVGMVSLVDVWQSMRMLEKLANYTMLTELAVDIRGTFNALPFITQYLGSQLVKLTIERGIDIVVISLLQGGDSKLTPVYQSR